MARAAQNEAKQNVEMGQKFANEANQTATGIGNWLQPTFTAEATDPNSVPWVQSAKGEAGQIASGNAASAGHKLGLMAERTGNRAGYAPAIDEATRQATQAEAGVDLGIDTEAARMGQAGLAGMYGQNLGAETGNLNAATGAVNAQTGAGNSGWFQNTIAALNALKPGYSGSGGATLGCWVAAEIYDGWEDPRTKAVRQHLFGGPDLSAFAKLYLQHGPKWAELAHLKPAIRAFFRPLFDGFLASA